MCLDLGTPNERGKGERATEQPLKPKENCSHLPDPQPERQHSVLSKNGRSSLVVHVELVCHTQGTEHYTVCPSVSVWL